MQSPRFKTIGARRADGFVLLVAGAVACGCGSSSSATTGKDAGPDATTDADAAHGVDSGHGGEASLLDAVTPDSAAADGGVDAGSPESGSDGGDGGVSGEGGEGGPPDGATDSGPGPTGDIVFVQSMGAGGGNFAFDAFFTPISSSGAGCTTSSSGACSLTVCSTPPTTGPGASAGTLSFSGGSIPPGAALPGPSYSYTMNGALYAAGQTLTVSGSGGTVPAFGPESVVAPALVSLTSPPLANPTPIATSTDLLVAWTGGQAGAMLALSAANNSATTYISCTWDATLGQATIPQALLAGLAGMPGSITWGQYASVAFPAGPYTIVLRASVDQFTLATFQ